MFWMTNKNSFGLTHKLPLVCFIAISQKSFLLFKFMAKNNNKTLCIYKTQNFKISQNFSCIWKDIHIYIYYILYMYLYAYLNFEFWAFKIDHTNEKSESDNLHVQNVS